VRWRFQLFRWQSTNRPSLLKIIPKTVISTLRYTKFKVEKMPKHFRHFTKTNKLKTMETTPRINVTLPKHFKYFTNTSNFENVETRPRINAILVWFCKGLQGIWCRHFGWQTVPCLCRGDGKCSVADSGQSCRRDAQCQRRRWPQYRTTAFR